MQQPGVIALQTRYSIVPTYSRRVLELGCRAVIMTIIANDRDSSDKLYDDDCEKKIDNLGKLASFLLDFACFFEAFA